MKVIDFDTRGNVVKLYFGKDDDLIERIIMNPPKTYK